MAKQRTKCWEDQGWVRGDQLTAKGGAQAHTFLARRKADPPDEFNYILKVLKRQDDANRRATFHAEASVLEATEHPGVLAIEATNSEQHKEPVDLYLVTRRIRGDDLEDIVKSGISFDDAITVTVGVLDVLSHCHSRGVVHRDIKPCHVIIPAGGDFASPKLIDFGLAYCEKLAPSDAETGPEEVKGNRFLIGPEHLPNSLVVNRDGVTDICQCLGLLYYLLNKSQPGPLLDEQQRMPHERAPLDPELEIPEWKREALNQILDKGFSWHRDQRWNDIDILRGRLMQLQSESHSPGEKLTLNAAAIVSRSGIKKRVEFKNTALKLSRRFFKLLEGVVDSIASGTTPHLEVTISNGGFGGFFITPSGSFETVEECQISFRLTHVNVTYAISVLSQLNKNAFVVSLRPYSGELVIFPNNEPIELASCTLSESEDLIEFRENLVEKLLACAEELLSKDHKTGQL